VVTDRRSEFAAVALAALSVAAALGFDRVFGSDRWLAPVVGAAIIPFGLGTLARRRHWAAPLTGVLSLAGLVLYVVFVIEPNTTVFGFPAASTFDALGADLRNGWEVLRNSHAPAPVTDGALLLAVVGTWIMAQIADHLAFRRQATVGALMPALVLFVVTAALGTDSGRLRWTAAFAVAAVAYLLLQHQSLLERGRARFAGPRVSGGTGLVVAGIGTGLAAVLIGMVVAPALPGAGDRAALDYRGLVDDGPDTYRTVTPIASVRSTLLRPEPELLFTVRAPAREYWRIAGLDEFDGQVWKLSSEGSDVAEGLDDPAGSSVLRQDFEIGPLGERWVPAAYRPVAVEGTDVLVVPDTSTLVSAGDSISNIDYTVFSDVPPTALDDAQRAAVEQPIPSEMARFTELPSDFPDAVRDVAEQITIGIDNPYDRAVALDDYFATDFTYDLNVDYGHSEDAMVAFLRDRRGFCEQFASTYAAMARSVGLPARVAVGFTPGEEREAGVFRVTTHDAHAWPEVWFAHVGWVRFEPTPPSAEPGGADGEAPAGTADATPGAGTGETPATTGAPGTVPTEAAPGAEIEIDAPVIDTPGGADDRIHLGWWAAVGLATATVVAGLAYIATVAITKARRRAKRRADPDPARAVSGAWAETLERLAEAGIAPSPAATPLEAAQTAGSRAPVAAREPLRSLAAAYTEARYGPRPPEADDARHAWAGADVIRSALDQGVGIAHRIRRALDPRVLRPR
jgi:transglutaminase-like putative cysteine protease